MLCEADAECEALSSGSICVASLVFEQAVAGSALDGNTKRWKYRNPAAKTSGGLYFIKITAKTAKRTCAGGTNQGGRCTSDGDCPQGNCVGYYVLKLKAYGDVTGAAADMQTRIYGGGLDNQQGSQFDVARDGRFLINTVLDDATTPITLIQNWAPPAR